MRRWRGVIRVSPSAMAYSPAFAAGLGLRGRSAWHRSAPRPAAWPPPDHWSEGGPRRPCSRPSASDARERTAPAFPRELRRRPPGSASWPRPAWSAGAAIGCGGSRRFGASATCSGRRQRRVPRRSDGLFRRRRRRRRCRFDGFLTFSTAGSGGGGGGAASTVSTGCSGTGCGRSGSIFSIRSGSSWVTKSRVFATTWVAAVPALPIIECAVSAAPRRSV